MNALRRWMCAARAWMLQREFEALQRRQARVKRELLNRPHMPSPHLLSGPAAGADASDAFLRAAPMLLWLRAVTLAVSFVAGFLAADFAHRAPAAASKARLQECHDIDTDALLRKQRLFLEQTK